MNLRKILVPIDFSPGADEAVRLALALARPLGATITLFHAYDVPYYVLPDGTAIATTAEILGQITSAVENELARVTALAIAAGEGAVRIDARAAQGAPAAEIARIAHEGDYDLVVMGTHGRTGLKRLLLGSVAERVLRTCDRPVLTARIGPPASVASDPSDGATVAKG